MTTTETRPAVKTFIADQAKTWPHTYDGIPIFEIGDDGEWLVTIGHIDKTAFAKACDAYYRAVSQHSLTEVYSGDVSLAEVAEDAAHQRADIRSLEEFPHGDFEVVFDGEDVDVTVWKAS